MKFLIDDSKDKCPVFMGLTLEEFDQKTAVSLWFCIMYFVR